MRQEASLWLAPYLSVVNGNKCINLLHQRRKRDFLASWPKMGHEGNLGCIMILQQTPFQTLLNKGIFFSESQEAGWHESCTFLF